MPHVLSPIVSLDMPGLWGEGPAYERKGIYSLASADPGSPPVNYSSHIIRPHSLPHVDAPSHTLTDGAGVEKDFIDKNFSGFFGSVQVLQIEGARFQAKGLVSHWEVSLEELTASLIEAGAAQPLRLFIDSPDLPKDSMAGFNRAMHLLFILEQRSIWLKMVYAHSELASNPLIFSPVPESDRFIKFCLGVRSRCTSV